ncbi:MAG TPA: aryl-sulfate sulfotransferase, partial [Bacteroidota bacterium]|nr:aryl-sulfate sulfotransferase [Bacteroidota bacterium]
KIDRNSGDIIWRWGGKNNQFAFLGDTLQFTYQHALRLIQNGNYILFDNGDLHNPPFSRAVEYQLDQNLKTATAVWQYRNTPDLYGYSTGYAQRLDDGNTLIDWGTTNPNVSLVAPDSTKIFDLTYPEGMYTYRAYMYPYTPLVLSVSPASESISLSPGSAQRESLKVVNFDTSESHYSISAHRPWLVLSSSTDSLSPSDSAFFDFTINAAGLSSWSVYRDTITISGYDTLHSAIQIPVILNTLGPKIFVNSTNLSIEIDSGTVTHDTLYIFNIGQLPLIYRVVDTDTLANSWMTFRTKPDTLAPGDSIIEDVVFNATTLPHGNYNTTLTIFNNDSSTGTVNIPVTCNVLKLLTTQIAISSGWNMVSMPVLPINNSKYDLFPTAISNVFTYDNSYVIMNSLKTDIGYWIKFDSSQSIPITGGILTTDSINVYSGWNMIGSILTPISVFSISSIPPGIQTSNFFTYNYHYFISDSILPGKGYWIKVDQDGTLVLSSGSSASPKNRIRIIQTSERPPLPPDASATKTSEIPKEYALDQAYPSPFNPTTTIRYQLPFESKVSLKIYNLLGQVVETLQNGIEDAGFKSVVWDAS